MNFVLALLAHDNHNSEKMMEHYKTYSEQHNIGKAKYTVSFHDGLKTHDDGSQFRDMRIFSNAEVMRKFIQKLEHDGYTKSWGINY